MRWTLPSAEQLQAGIAVRRLVGQVTKWVWRGEKTSRLDNMTLGRGGGRYMVVYMQTKALIQCGPMAGAGSPLVH